MNILEAIENNKLLYFIKYNKLGINDLNEKVLERILKSISFKSL